MSLGPVRPAQHTNYQRVQNQRGLEVVWERLSLPGKLPRGTLQEIHAQTRIPINTLKTWRKKLLRDARYRPVHGQPGHSNVLSDDIESEIWERVKTDYIDLHKYCPRCVLKEVARQIVGDRVPNFKAGHSWCNGFMSRWGLSLRKPHVRRRTAPADGIVASFIAEFDVALMQLPKRLIFNMDESAWRIMNGQIRTITRKGSDEVFVETPHSMKQTITVIATIDAEGGKLPLWIIAEGKTSKCEARYRDDERLRKYIKGGDLLIGHSKSGWATAPLMRCYLKWLNRYTHYRHKYLVWDLHSSHRDEDVKQYACQKNTTLSFVPAGQTGLWQPLDRRIFGAIKSACHSEFQKMMLDSSLDGVDLIDALVILLQKWKQLKPRTVKAAWSHLIERDEEPEYEYDVESYSEDEYDDSSDETHA